VHRKVYGVFRRKLAANPQSAAFETLLRGDAIVAESKLYIIHREK